MLPWLCLLLMLHLYDSYPSGVAWTFNDGHDHDHDYSSLGAMLMTATWLCGAPGAVVIKNKTSWTTQSQSPCFLVKHSRAAQKQHAPFCYCLCSVWPVQASSAQHPKGITIKAMQCLQALRLRHWTCHIVGQQMPATSPLSLLQAQHLNCQSAIGRRPVAHNNV
jgi:hypothetical protein